MTGLNEMFESLFLQNVVITYKIKTLIICKTFTFLTFFGI